MNHNCASRNRGISRDGAFKVSVSSQGSRKVANLWSSVSVQQKTGKWQTFGLLFQCNRRPESGNPLVFCFSATEDRKVATLWSSVSVQQETGKVTSI
jgi:hypothetical protein